MDFRRKDAARIREIFTLVKDLSEAERFNVLSEICGEDRDQLNEIASLLVVYDSSTDLLQHDASGLDLNRIMDLTGSKIGPYYLIERIGEGGFGEVYRAEQAEPFRREVALKIIKLGLDTRSIIARFELERQAMARMNHPGIAQVYDAGATESGRPYFVMELVRGITFIDYCDRHRLTLSDRLQLFKQICEAVQHAHERGILHRDLKPSNILVAEEHEKPFTKIIDFGVAKSLRSPLTKQSLITIRDMLIGTPMYMSPEQLEGHDEDVDGRTDVYSLGIILYELLAGAPPLENERLSLLTISETRQALEDNAVLRPSIKFRSLGRETTTIASVRQIKPPALERLLRGDLDWIVMKAIDRKRDRRYESATALVYDLEQYLSHETVSAGPPSPFRRLDKFVHRHSVFSITALSIGVSLALCSGIAVCGYLRLVRPPPDVQVPGWKLEKFCSFGDLRANSFEVRSDGSVLIVGEWGRLPKGVYWLRKGEICTVTNALSSGPAFTDPEGVAELDGTIYLTLNRSRNKILSIPSEGGNSSVFYDNQKIINPYTILVVPESFSGPNVSPGEFVVFDNAFGNVRRTGIWSVDKASGVARPFLIGNELRKCFLNGCFSPDGMLYAGLNDGGSGASILRISPEGTVEVVLKNFYFSPVRGDLHRPDVAVHPITGEVFFCTRQETFVLAREDAPPRRVLMKGEALRWAPDGGKLYLIDENAIWTVTGPDIISRPVIR